MASTHNEGVALVFYLDGSISFYLENKEKSGGLRS